MNSPFLDNRKKIFSNKIGFIIEDKFPVTKGHLLIVPFRVYSNYFDSTNEELLGFSELLKYAKKYSEEKFSPAGFNIGVNCGEAAGQTIDHMHIHLIPRYNGDVKDPTGGIRGVIPNKQKYQK